MRRMQLALTLATCLAAAAPLTPAQAHRQWLLPSTASVEGDAPYVTFDAATSEGLFDFDAQPIRLEGLTITGPDGQSVQPENAASGKRRSVFDLKLVKPGTYRAAIISATVMASYMLDGEQKRWRGSESALAGAIPAEATDVRISRTEARVETFVTAGEPTTTVLAPTGKGLELVPLTHPGENVMGTPARFRALLDGKPVAGLDITIVPGGGRFRSALNDMSVKTDANGEIAVKWPMPGMVWLGASWPAREAAPEGPRPPMGAPVATGDAPPAPPANRPAAPPRRLNYSATFEVAPF